MSSETDWEPVPAGAYARGAGGEFPPGYSIRVPFREMTRPTLAPEPCGPSSEAAARWGQRAREWARTAPLYRRPAAPAGHYWDLVGIQFFIELIGWNPVPPPWFFAPARSELLVEGQFNWTDQLHLIWEPLPTAAPEVKPVGHLVAPAWELDRRGGPLGDAYGRLYRVGRVGGAFAFPLRA